MIYVKVIDGVVVEKLNYPSKAPPVGEEYFQTEVPSLGWGLVGENWVDNRDYIIKRKEEYPPAEDYLDGIVKGDTAQVDKYIADCLAVKSAYPKT
jgi:hypothetical protein